MVIYVDVLIAVNFFITYFLLMAASIISGYTYNRKRIIVSALIGAFFCLYIFVQQENIFIDFAIKAISVILCAVIAFDIGNIKKLILQTASFIMLNALLTGIVTALSLKSSIVYQKNMFFYFNINPILLVFSSAVIYIILTVFSHVKENITPNKTYSMDIIFEDFCLCTLPAFYDSGFKVKDIVSNKDVVILSIEKVKEKLPLALCENLQSFLTEDYQNVQMNFVPIFFTTISGEGMIPAIKAVHIKIEGKIIENILVAFVKNELSENVAVIFGTNIKRQF